jgi:hypothetical protein
LSQDLIICERSRDNVIEITLDYFTIDFQCHTKAELKQAFNIFKQFTTAVIKYIQMQKQV